MIALPNFKKKRVERLIVDPGVPLCVDCQDKGTIEVHPEAIGEHSAQSVRADLAAGHLRLCSCETGRFWETMIDPVSARTKGG